VFDLQQLTDPHPNNVDWDAPLRRVRRLRSASRPRPKKGMAACQTLIALTTPELAPVKATFIQH
jgi:hypothetical protein